MEQVVERFPQVLGSLSTEYMEGKLEFLLSVGVPKDQLGQVGTSTFVLGFRVQGLGFRVTLNKHGDQVTTLKKRV
jgi:hypothetical protein